MFGMSDEHQIHLILIADTKRAKSSKFEYNVY